MPRRRKTGQGAGGGFDHRVGYVPSVGGNDAQRQTRENVGVIGLVNLNFPAIEFCRAEGASCANQRAAIRPIEQILRPGFTTGSRVGEREDNGD